MTTIQQQKVDEPYLDIQCLLGEGPHYDERNKEFRFLDVDKRQIHFIDPAKGASSLRTIEHPGFKVGVTADIEGNDDEFAIAAETFFGVMNRHTGKHRVLKELWTGEPDEEHKKKRCRMNDGSIDPQGRFWAGTMVDPDKGHPDWLQPAEHENALFRLEPDLTLTKVVPGGVCHNGMSWTKNQKTMYWTDTPTGIYKCDFDPKTGNFSKQEVFFKSKLDPKDMMAADGHAMDEEEHLWVACYGASKVVRVNPKGDIVREIVFPCPKITCPAFMGTELWVTSIGRERDTEGGKYGGSLFKVDVGVKGMKKNLFNPKQ